jgi:HKD family nuclease
MFARIVKMNLKPAHIADWNTTFENKILPVLRKEKGFQDQITFVGPSGTEIMSVSLWDRKESAETYNAVTYPELLKTLSNMLEGSPQLKTYEVGNSTFHKIPVPAAV